MNKNKVPVLAIKPNEAIEEDIKEMAIELIGLREENEKLKDLAAQDIDEKTKQMLLSEFQLNTLEVITLVKMCQAIVIYNKSRNINNEQFFVRHDMFIKIKEALGK